MTNTELQHYGVLGMKWGRRKNQGKVFKYQDEEWDRLNDFDTGDIAIKKGSKAYRVSNTRGAKSLDREHLYATVNTLDRSAYASDFAGVVKKYELSFVVKKDLLSPGYKKRVDTFIQEYEKNPDKMVKSLSKFAADSNFVTERKRNGTLKPIPKHIQQSIMEKSLMSYSKQQMRTKGYSLFTESLETSPEIRRNYIKNLKKQGYNMVLDDNDIFKGFATSPIIVFDPKKNLDYINTSKMSPASKEKWLQYVQTREFEFTKNKQNDLSSFIPDNTMTVSKNLIGGYKEIPKGWYIKKKGDN